MIKRLFLFVFFITILSLGYHTFVTQGVLSLVINQTKVHLPLGLALIFSGIAFLLLHWGLNFLQWIFKAKNHLKHRASKQRSTALDQALMASMQENWPASLSALRKALNYSTQDEKPVITLCMAVSEMFHGQYANAQQILDTQTLNQQVGTEQALKPVLLHLEKLCAKLENNPSTLYPPLEKLREVHGPSKEIDSTLAHAYLAGKQFQKALAIVEEGYLDSTTQTLLQERAHAALLNQYCDLGEYQAAQEYYVQLPKQLQNSPDCLAAFASSLIHAQAFEKAQRTIFQGLNKNPTHPFLGELLFFTTTSHTACQTAQQALEEIVQTHPHCIEPLEQLARVWELLQQPEKALSAYKDILEYHYESDLDCAKLNPIRLRSAILTTGLQKNLSTSSLPMKDDQAS